MKNIFVCHKLEEERFIQANYLGYKGIQWEGNVAAQKKHSKPVSSTKFIQTIQGQFQCS